MSFPFITGTVSMQSDMSIFEIAELLSAKLFGSIDFQGLDKNIYEEVPALFINSDLLGLKIVLSGYTGHSKDERFVLHISPNYSSAIYCQVEVQEINLSEYLKKLVEYYFKDDDRFKLL